MKKIYETIYKLSTKGKTQIWFMEQDDDKYRTTSGQYESPNLITTDWTTAKPKNEGKKNETSGIQQATLEIEAQYKKKLSQGNYKSSIDDIDKDNYFEPMLAKDYNDHKPTTLQFASLKIHSQPKLDGCVSGDTLISTNKGQISIEEIYNSDESYQILTFNEKTKKNELKSVINKMKDLESIDNLEIEWLEIELENGNKLKVTGNHLIYLPKLKCYRRADQLKENDEFLLI